MNCSLIITTYNWKSALELAILSVFNQSYLPVEIIIGLPVAATFRINGK